MPTSYTVDDLEIGHAYWEEQEGQRVRVLHIDYADEIVTVEPTQGVGRKYVTSPGFLGGVLGSR